MKQRYDSYKPSGIDWIGEIPSHWELCPIKHIKSTKEFAFVDGPFGSNLKSEHFIENGDVYVIESGFITTGKFVYKKFKTISKDHFETIRRSECTAGDVIIAKIGYNYGMVGELPKLDKPSVVSGNSLKITLDNSKILNYIFINLMNLAKNRNAYIGLVQETAQPALSLSGLNNFILPVPPLSEQEAIAAWLDEKCDEIDTAIAKVDREIELIDELKQSEISRVVTRGFNPDAPLRPSGIDWIGDVPAHWTKSRIKHHICRSAAGVWGEDEKGNEDDVVCFRIADFNYGERCLGFEKITLRNIEAKQLEGRLLSEGDLLIEKSGGGDATPVGRVVYCNYSGKATCTNFIHSITLKKDVDSQFFLFYFNMLYSNKINLLFFNQTTGLQNLQVGDYLAQSLYLPPFSEQKAIADYLDKKCSEIDGLKEKLIKKRETLKELRQAIISEVVTGKRKVI